MKNSGDCYTIGVISEADDCQTLAPLAYLVLNLVLVNEFGTGEVSNVQIK
ncbi:hypothetical protein [Bacillus sp. AFS014408]|nr:hypothetical protein [Bacillus sp. AFS014408]